MNFKNSSKICFFLWLILNIVLIQSCMIVPKNQDLPDSNISEKFPKATRTPDLSTVTPSPTAPIGSELNPIVFGIAVTNENEVDTEALAQLLSLLSTETEQDITMEYYDTYPPLISDIQDGTVQIAWLPPLISIMLEEQNFTRPALLSNHFGVYQYSTQILANTDQGFQSYYDLNLNQSTDSADIALSQFEGLRPCWVDQDSISGHLLPAGLFAQNEIELKEGVITKSPSSTIRALAIGGICDFGATYGGNGDPRTASSLTDIPDVMEKIEIIWQSDPIIPNYNISFHRDLPDSIQEELKESILSISDSIEGNDLFSKAFGYEITGFEPCTSSTFAPLSEILDALNSEAESVSEE